VISIATKKNNTQFVSVSFSIPAGMEADALVQNIVSGLNDLGATLLSISLAKQQY